MRQRYPGVPVVTYVNTSAAVKAESDICCTSGNALKVMESLGVERVIMLPDEYLAQNIAAQTGVKIIAWKGHCEVHERFTPADIRQLRENHPGVTVLAHPECPPEVVAEADFSGSTAAMSDFVGKQRPSRVVLLTECSMSDNVSVLHPDIEFIRPCNLCPHMKRITLKNIRHALETGQHDVTIDPAIAAPRPARGRKDAGGMITEISALGQPSRHHRRRRRRLDDGASTGARAGIAALEGAARRRKPPACGRRADSPRRWARTTTLLCIWPTRSPPALACATKPSRAASSMRPPQASNISPDLASPSTVGPMAAGGSASKPPTAVTGSCTPPATAPAARSCAR